jgi:branched-subunit amino acid ABC-type transport system permease component
MSYFLALVIDGALAGAIYALIALAFVLVYRASAMMNFALGEWVVFGAVLAGTGLHFLQLGTLGALIFAALGMIALAAGFYRLAVRRLVARPALSAIMVTLGLGMVMRGSGLLLFSAAPGLIPQSFLSEPIRIGEIVIAADRLAAAGVAALCGELIGGFYRFSRTGIALRAIADDPQAAMSAGIDVGPSPDDRVGLERHGGPGRRHPVDLRHRRRLRRRPDRTKSLSHRHTGWPRQHCRHDHRGDRGGRARLGAGYLDEALGRGFGGIASYLALLAMLMLRPYGLLGQPRIERV